MNTKWKLNNILFVVLSLIITVFSSCKNKERDDHKEHTQQESVTYTCPMHPQVQSDQPGKCPICKMNLEPMAEETLVQTASPNKQVLSRQATLKLQSGSNEKSIKAQGFIDIDPNRNHSVSSRFGGRIEKLYLKFNLQYVKKGEKIMDLYSPELQTIQEEHLFLIRSKAENSLFEKSRERLRLLGITENQIKQLEEKGTVAFTVSIFSPSDGYVFFNEQSPDGMEPSESTSAMDGMGTKTKIKKKNIFSSTSSQIREGTYVNAGQTLFSVNDLQQVWVLVSLPAPQLSQINEKQSVEIISENNSSKILKGKISLIEQTFEENNQRFARVRIELPNADKSLKINSLINARFSLSNNKNLQVPASAVYRTGLNSYVWVKTGKTKNGTGIFQLRKVIARESNNGMAFILNGLSPDEEIAKEAGFMTDSETFLNAD
ncbi:MAG: efflux RND transporter periplasmic adaptor subunit [Bacteroidia bacterium]|nr:efflux RND transporter periplasmic adaptor subunit [Bacteroidia bacterium]